MAECSVLRCVEPAAHVLQVNKPGGALLLEAAVCEGHHGQIAAGAAWDWNWEHGEILMGADATRLSRPGWKFEWRSPA